MDLLRGRTREQKLLTIPLLGGSAAGLAGLAYLFSIPADPKNSLIFGFSMIRLLEGLGLVAGAAVLLVLFINIFHSPDFLNHFIIFMGWQNGSPWSVAAAWVGLLFSLLFGSSAGTLFPDYYPVFLRLLPITLWVSVFYFLLLITYGIWAGRKAVRNTAFFLLKVSLIAIVIGFMGGIFVFPAKLGLMLRQGSLILILIFSVALYFCLQKSGFPGFASGLLIVGLLLGGALIGVWTSA
ncbi:MAG TPA: hypothetical protein VF338_09800, partial [Leptolinea sp.]